MATTAAEFNPAGKQACSTCSFSKQHKVLRFSSTSDTEKPLELIHKDVCGPTQVPSLGGSLYLATDLESYSKLSVVRPVKRNSEVRFKRIQSVMWLAMSRAAGSEWCH